MIITTELWMMRQDVYKRQDVSTDISVLHTVLAQEGLTENDFEKMKQNAEMK